MSQQATTHPTVEARAALQAWRERALQVTLMATLGVGVIPLLTVLLKTSRSPSHWPAALVFLVAYLSLIPLLSLHHLYHYLRAWGFLVAGYATAGLAMARGGLAGSGRVYLLALPSAAIVLRGVHSGMAAALLSLFIYGGFALAARRREADSPLALRLELNEGRLPEEEVIALFRVFQEGLSNVERHAQASAVEIGLALTPAGILLTIRDDGCGFAVPRHLGDLAQERCFGLMGARERMGALGGRLEVISRPGDRRASVGWRGEGEMSEIRVLLADDHPVIRAGLRAEMERAGGIRVVGEACDGEETLRLVGKLYPDVVALDMVLPGLNGIEAARRLRETQPGVRVLILSGYDDEDLILGALEAGAAGYLLKEEEPGTIVAAVRAVARGEEGWYSRPVMAKVTSWARGKTSQPPERAELTEREVEVLRLVARGGDNARIAEELCVAEGTVKNYVTNIYAKLNFHSRAQAVAWAWQHGVMGER